MKNSGRRKYLAVSVMFVIVFNLVLTARAGETNIPGDPVIEQGIFELGQTGKIEKEFHLYVTDGYQEMADESEIYIWGYAHAKDFADVGEIKTEEERDKKLLPVKTPGDEIRFTSGKNYVIVLHNAGWYETEKHSGINHVAHTIHFHGLDLIPAVDGVPNLPYPSVFPGETYRYLLMIPEDVEGTYIGHCHVDSTNHIMAGMYFPIVVEKNQMKSTGINSTENIHFL